VTAPSWSFSETSVTVPVCENHGAAVSVNLKVSALLDLEVPAESVRHSEGLVTFA
jgi:hypothetical protein